MNFIRDLGLWWASQVNFQDDSAGKESDYNVGDTGDEDLIPGSGRAPGEGNGNQF